MRRAWPGWLVSALLGAAPVTSLAQQATAPPPGSRQPQRPAQRSSPKKGATPVRALTPVEQRIQAVEAHLIPTVRIKGKPVGDMALAARMRKYHVPGAAIAVINDYSLEWAKGYGEADTATLFQAGAAGEPVAAMLALRLAQARKLDLSRDVNRSLKSWKIPKSDLTKPRPITPRALLAHSAGLTVTTAQGYEPGTPLPPLSQLLGRVVSVAAPGEVARPSAADYDVVEQLITDLTKRPYAGIAADSVLGPLAMHHSGFFEPSGADARLAATGHDEAGHPISGKWRDYREVAASGLWTTPSDLAQLVLEMERASAGRGGKLLNADGARQLLTAEHVGWPGLGVMLEGRDQSTRFRASGATEGYKAQLLGYVSRGQGVVVMTNGAAGGALIEEIQNAVASVYGWPDFLSPERTVAKVDVGVYDRFVGRYAFDSREVSVARRGTRLFIGPAGKETTEILPQSVSEFFSTEPGALYSFVFDEQGKVQAFTEKQQTDYTRWDRK